jgi:hypothetical protein
MLSGFRSPAPGVVRDEQEGYTRQRAVIPLSLLISAEVAQ